MATRRPLIVNNRMSMIPTRARLDENHKVLKNSVIGQENGPAGKGVSTKVAVKGSGVTTRHGLIALDKNVGIGSQPNVLQKKKVVSTPEKPEFIKSSATAVTVTPSPSTKVETNTRFAPDSYASINLKDFFKEEELNSLEDPDRYDHDAECALSVYAKDVVKYQLQLEERFRISTNYLSGHDHITPESRRTLMNWLGQLQKQYRLLSETFSIAQYILDGYVSKERRLPVNKYQLVGITALLIASKYEEITPPTVEDLVNLSQNACTVRDVHAMERSMLQSLDFMLQRPPPIAFLRRISKVSDVDTETHALAKYFVELSSFEYWLVGVRPSKIAAASLFLSLTLWESRDQEFSLKQLDEEAAKLWSVQTAVEIGYPAEAVKPVAYELCLVVLDAHKKYEVIYKKYASSRFLSVSREPFLDSPLVRLWASRATLVKTKPSLSSSRPKATNIRRTAASTAVSSAGIGSNRPPFRV
ncbi:unnamed protein product [Notodromas monacha]|uniref:Uncharacterized protein n=1 Tax=Notodromas monacha TaxID=399045 RepID=A0A7R9BDK5_9CRUS|nr:unnamed protein product [Notodromas monacha]CAG0913372.1 unnamed protein product [Notodromas monacha]